MENEATSSTAELPRDEIAPRAGADLKQKTARGAVVSVLGQAVNFLLRTGSMVVLARLVTPEEFGVVGMVAAFTGFLSLFRDAGLSMATIQRQSITDAQTSTLFWVNAAVGSLLVLVCAAMGPVLSEFYREPRLTWVAIGLGSSFFFYGVSAQHRALLQRAMRFGTLVIVDTIALIGSVAVGIGMALAGAGYWSLVGMSASLPFISCAGLWLSSTWIPSLPRKGAGVRSMLQYGGLLTLNSLVVYVVYNADKILLGRVLGAQVLGLYGRAYQLISMPTENLNSVIGWVMFPALSRVQGEPARLRKYFLRGYGLFVALVMPVTVACGLFADDVVLVLLGPQWTEAAAAFRLLTPTILVLGLINPLSWFLQANGLAMRSLKMSFLIAPVVIGGYVLGLPFGLKGVAAGFSIAMLLLVVPLVLWAIHKTVITPMDMVRAISPPIAASLISAAVAFFLGQWLQDLHSAFLRLVLVSAGLFASYALVLLFGLRQKAVYYELFSAAGIWPFSRRSAQEGGMAA